MEKKDENRSKKLFFILLGIFIILDLFIAVFLFATRHFSPVYFESYGSSKMERIYALNKNAHKGLVPKTGIACFKFSEAEQTVMESIYNEHESVSITVRLRIKPSRSDKLLLDSSEKTYFKFGYLDDYDFTDKGKYIPLKYISNQRIVVQGDLKNAPEVFDVSFALKKTDDISSILPEGFFIYSAIRCQIEGVYAAPAKMGFDYSSEIPFYGFAANGGEVGFSKTTFDFSGAAMLFSSRGGNSPVQSQYLVKLSNKKEFKSTSENSIRSQVNFGGEVLNIKNVEGADQIVIPSFALKSPYPLVQVKTNIDCIEAIILEVETTQQFSARQKREKSGNEVLYPIKTDPGLILNYPQENWRTLDYEIFTWDRFSNILFFDIRNLRIQDDFFRRMAFFVEKAGYKGRLLTNEELGDMHGYNAHDYSAASMADFFNTAEKLNFKLNSEELLLKRILIANGFFEVDGDYVIANEGGLVSISRETPAWSRVSLLAHESWHTIFFCDPDFRNFVSAIYYTMDQKSLSFLIKYFQSQPSLGYDVTDEYLMHNEFMAYMMQQGISALADYYVTRAKWKTVTDFCPEEAEYIRETNAQGLEDAAIALNDYVFGRFGIVAGNVSLVSR